MEEFVHKYLNSAYLRMIVAFGVGLFSVHGVFVGPELETRGRGDVDADVGKYYLVQRPQ